MPVASVIGCDPLLFILGAARISAFTSEYDVAGALRGEPVQVVQGETVDLPIPAHAELKEGILTVTLPKIRVAEKHTVKVA